jgi:hypothetical protein
MRLELCQSPVGTQIIATEDTLPRYGKWKFVKAEQVRALSDEDDIYVDGRRFSTTYWFSIFERVE